MNSQSQKNPQIPYHYWAVNKRVLREYWDALTPRQREIISHDVTHASEVFRRFNKDVTDETNRRFLNPDYSLNQPYTFSYGYWNERQGSPDTEEIAQVA